MNVGSISNTSTSTYKASDSSLEALKKQRESLQQQLLQVNSSKLDDKTKQDKVEQLQQQIEQIDAQIQQKEAQSSGNSNATQKVSEVSSQGKNNVSTLKSNEEESSYEKTQGTLIDAFA
ncbi:hypothetical protein D3C81_1316390 [compost metagenome]